MAMLSKVSKPDNFESHNSLRHNSTKIGGLHSSFAVCDSFLESSSPGTLPLFETNLYDSIDPDNISVGDFLPLVQRDSVTHAWFCSLCEGGTSINMGRISRQLWGFFFIFSAGFIQRLISFSSIDHVLCRFYGFWCCFI